MSKGRPPLKDIIYHKVGPLGRYLYGRWQFAAGRRPTVSPSVPPVVRPSPYRACVVLSADFELAWGWRYTYSAKQDRSQLQKKALQSRRNLPQLLDLLDSYQAPTTWATVGHLFLESCIKREGRPHANMPRVPYFENEYWHFTHGDWFDDDPCSDLLQAPAWYGADLLEAIVARKTKHEIGCHTFSHIVSSDIYCPPHVFDAELSECKRLAAEWGVSLTSLVFPGNLPGNLESLKQHGFKAYRFHGQYQIGIPGRDKNGLWQIPGGLNLEKPPGWPVQAWIRALEHSVNCTLETGGVLHLWFHPSCNSVNVEIVLPALLEYLSRHRNDLWVGTMAGLMTISTGATR